MPLVIVVDSSMATTLGSTRATLVCSKPSSIPSQVLQALEHHHCHVKKQHQQLTANTSSLYFHPLLIRNLLKNQRPQSSLDLQFHHQSNYFIPLLLAFIILDNVLSFHHFSSDHLSFFSMPGWAWLHHLY